MNILKYGTIQYCKNIVFSDNMYDIKGRHPGIVILPTSENEEEAYCLYRTTDRNRVNRESHKYIKFKGKTDKDSYINLEQIVKCKNTRAETDYLSENEFIKILESFYNYQENIESDKEYLLIRNKVKILLELLKSNQSLGFECDEITRKDLEVLEGLGGSEKVIRMIYGTKLVIDNPNKTTKIDSVYFKNEREIMYSGVLSNIYETLKNIDFDKLDLNDENNVLKEAHISIIKNNPLINCESSMLFVSYILELNNKEKEATKVREFLDSLKDKRVKAVRKCAEETNGVNKESDILIE